MWSRMRLHQCQAGYRFLVLSGSLSHLHQWFRLGSRRWAYQCVAITKLGAISNMLGDRQSQDETELSGLEQWARSETRSRWAPTAGQHLAASHLLHHPKVGMVWWMPSSWHSHFTPCLWLASSFQSRNISAIRNKTMRNAIATDLPHGTAGPARVKQTQMTLLSPN